MVTGCDAGTSANRTGLRSVGQVGEGWGTRQPARRRPLPSSAQISSRRGSIRFLSRVPDEAAGLCERAREVFAVEDQEVAFGRPGEAGSAEKIVELARQLVAVYCGMLEMSWHLQELSVPADLEEWRAASAALVDEPAAQIHSFIERVCGEMAALPNRLEQGDPVNITLVMELDLSAKALERFKNAVAAAS